jgi:penicillin-binding protein 1A
VNTVFAQLIGDVGVKDTAELAHRVGLTMINPDGKLPSGEPYGPSLTLGAAEVSPLDMASAYGVFANRGQQLAPSPVTRVVAYDGTVLEDNRNRRPKRAISESVADQVNDVLQDVVAYGTGAGADIGHPKGTAGKTGTSEDYGDAWFVGYTPQLSTAIWVGYSDSRRPLTNIKGQARVYGATFGVPTWKAYMSEAAPELGLTDFAAPGPPPTTSPPYTGGAVSPPAPAVTEPSPPTTSVAPAPAVSQPTRPTTPTTRVPVFTPPTTLFRPTPTYLPPTTRYTPPTTQAPPFTFPP